MVDRSRKKLKAPESSYLTDLQASLADQYLQQDNDIDIVREQREMRRPALAEADKDYVLVHVDPRDPDITEEAFQQTAILTLERPKLSIVGGEGDTAQTVASKLEHFTEETLWECGTREPGSDTMTQVTDATLNDGGGWAKILWQSDLWSERYKLKDPTKDPSSTTTDYTAYDKQTEEAKKRAGPPFVWSYVDPRSVYPQRSGGKLAEVLEVSQMPLRSAFRRYRLGLDTGGNIVPEELGQSENIIEATSDPLAQVTFLEHWDDTWCFPANTLVESDSDLVGAYKRWYEGELVTIRTARGHKLSGTPNHPIMTERGWVPLGQLQQGDRVISRTFSERAASRNPDPQHREAPIGQVFRLLDGLGVRQRRMGTVQDFHGDGTEHQIDVVRTDRVLWDRILTTLAQPVQQLALTTANERQGLGIGHGLSLKSVARARLSTDRRVAAFSHGTEGSALIGGHSFPAKSRGFEVRTSATSSASHDGINHPMIAAQVGSNLQRRLTETEIPMQDIHGVRPSLSVASRVGGFLSAAHGNAGGFEARTDGAGIDTQRGTDLDTGLTLFDVAADDVIHVERKRWAGHVFNLESIGHTYSANGIIAHNCSYAICGQNYQGDRTGYIVKQFEHKYPFGVPYDYAPGLTMNWWRNRKVGWGIGRTKLWLVQYRAFLRGMHAQYVARDLLSPLVTYGDTPATAVIGDNGLPKEPQTAVHPGEILNLPPGRQLMRIQYPDAATLEKHMSLIDGAIRDLESPRVTTLSGMEGAGFAISQVLSYSRTRVGPIRHGIESLLKGQTEKMWELIRSRAKEKVWVFSGGVDVGSGTAVAEFIGFGPSDLERPMRLKWEVQSQLPTDEMIQARYAHERLAAGTYGKDEAVTFLGDNPDEIRRSIARDRIRASPEYEKWLDAEVFMEAGRGDMLQKAQDMEQRALAGNLPANNPALPSGTPQPGVFEGGGPGAGGVPDLGALAAAPNGAGVGPPGYPQVVGGAQQPGGTMPPGGVAYGPQGPAAPGGQ